QLTIGMFSYHASERVQLVQCEPGQASDSRRGRREMHTLRKLPTHAPSTASTVTTSPTGISRRNPFGEVDRAARKSPRRLCRTQDRGCTLNPPDRPEGGGRGPLSRTPP